LDVAFGGIAITTTVNSGGYEQVFSGGAAANTISINGGTFEVASGGTGGTVLFGSGGTLQLDASSYLSGTISGFHLGDEIDLRGLAFSSSSSTVSWTQTTSGVNASGTLTVKEGASSMSFTLVGSYTSGNFSATSDGHGGTLITDPPISGGAVVTSSGTGSGSEGIAAPGSGTAVHSGGYEFGGGWPAADTNIGGGMMRLDSLLSRFAGVISGFDLGDEIGPHSLGFGSSSGAMSWMQQAPRADPGAPGKGDIFNLSVLGQYAAASFSGGMDGHGATMITDPHASSSVVQTPLVVHHP
jgi:autotransporter passenger strand-loop-strand repeat protein